MVTTTATPAPVDADEWELDVMFTSPGGQDTDDGATASCDTSDGCASSCASACASD